MKRAFRSNLLIAGLAFGAVGVAAALQAAWHLQPCTMCILQRYAFLVIGFLALGRLRYADGSAALVSRAVSNLAAAVGLLASLRIQWVISVPSATCGRDKVAAFLNNLPWVDTWPSLFEATGVCGDPVPPVLGLSFHGWALMLFTTILLLTWRAARPS